MHDVIFDKILGNFSFLNYVFDSKPKLENFLTIFFGISCSPSSTISSFAAMFPNWKNQSSFNRFLTESNWSIQQLTEKYQEYLVDERPQYFIIDDSKAEKTDQ